MTLPEVMYHNIDVSGGVRTPPLIQIIYIYVITHGHRTRHDPLHRAAGRQGTHDIAHEQHKHEAHSAALQAAEERKLVCDRLEGGRWQAGRYQLPPWA